MSSVTTDVRWCARCGGDHPNLTFERLDRHVDGDPPMTHWASCPATGEPILMRIAERPTPRDIKLGG